MRKMHLRDITDVEVLQEIQDSFSEATGLSAVTVDFKGKPITDYSNFTNFCKLIREDGKCRDACHRSDAHGGLEAARRERPYIYRCHTGLVDFAIPIIINGQYMGSIMAGQVKIEENELNRLDHIVKEIPHWRNNKEIMDAYKDIPVISYDKIAGAAQMMFIVCNHIIEKDMMSMMQEELSIKNTKLMDEIKARAELERALKDTELKALQSQVNPHFLFNVLNTLGRLALIEDAPKTQEIVYALADMLRYSLKNTNQLVELKEEINHIERYLTIQSIRFGDRIKHKIEIPASLEKAKIPPMALQSLVENSMNHGLEPKESEGEIKIIGYAVEDDIIIEITDNGIGIDHGKLKIILDESKDTSSISKSMGIGIYNVNKRLSYHYGPQYKLEIKSSVNLGTTVKVKIPKDITLRRVTHV